LLTGERVKNAPFSTHLRIKVSGDMPVERFLPMLRFENKAKLGDLGIEIDIHSPKSIEWWFESGF